MTEIHAGKERSVLLEQLEENFASSLLRKLNDICVSVLQHLWQLRVSSDSEEEHVQLFQEVDQSTAPRDNSPARVPNQSSLTLKAAEQVEEIVDAAPKTHADSLWEKTAEVLHRMDPGEEINDIMGNDDSGGEGIEKQTGSSSRRNHRGDKGQRKALQDPPFIMPMTGVPGGIGAPSFDNWTLYMLDDSPLLLHQAIFHQPGCRLGGDLNKNGQPHSAVLRYAVDSAGRMHSWSPETSINPKMTDTKLMYPAHILPSLPYNDTRWTFDSCAIVSNSGTLLKAQFGDEIDTHDAVFRLNNAPTVGFERYVGSKTTFNLLNRPHADEISHQTSMTREGEPLQAAVLFEADNWHLYYHLLERMLKHMPYPKTLVLAPSFLDKVNQLWMRLAKRWPRHANSCTDIRRAAHEGDQSARCQKMIRDCQNDVCKPSSGFFALVLASQMCNKIDMYGFESWRKSYPSTISTKRRHSHYHYFDDEEGVTSVHSFVLIMKVFEFLSHRFPIIIKTPDYDPEEERHMEMVEKAAKSAEPLLYGKQGLFSSSSHVDSKAKAKPRGREWIREHFKSKEDHVRVAHGMLQQPGLLGTFSSLLKHATDDHGPIHLRAMRANDKIPHAR